MIQLNNVSLIYGNGVQALKEINLTIDDGQFVFLVGATGSGKSTLLKLLYHEERPTTGQVVVDGIDVTKMNARQVPSLRRGMGIIFQDYRLLPQKTAFENVAFALQVTGVRPKEIRRRVPDVLELVGLSSRIDSYPHELSGGEQQRVSIARALVNRPKTLIADEPTGNLDPDTSWDIFKLLDQINTAGTTVLVASHDKYIVDELKKRVIALEKGNLTRDEKAGVYYAEAAL
jgi:cell division transport system ATP-binding protein